MLRFDVLQTVIDSIGADSYLEIGLGPTAKCFTTVNVNYKLGIDPNSPFNIGDILSENAEYLQHSSDYFFEHVAQNTLLNRKIDVAFIDGFHEYQQTLREVNHCLSYLSPKGVIVLHDCKPYTKLIATPISDPSCEAYRKWKGPWMGDVWKTIVYLRSFRKDLNVFVLDCDNGLGIVTKGEYKELMDLKYTEDQINEMDYDFFEKEQRTLLNLKPVDYLFTFLEEHTLSFNKAR